MRSTPVYLILLRRVLLADALIFGGTALVCLVVPQWRSWYDYSNGLIVVCAALLAVAGYSLYGGWMQTGSFSYQYGSSINPDEIHQRASRFTGERNAGLRLIIQGILIAVLPLLASLLIQRAVLG